MAWVSRPVERLSGTITAPGDKSCSHRALMFAAMADGQSTIEGLLEGDDVVRTGIVMRQLGANFERTGIGSWNVTGVGTKGLQTPNATLDFGNSGTGSRLMAGVCAGYPITARFDGDTSLRARPMDRVTDPLSQMGAVFEATNGRLPMTVRGSDALSGISYAPPHASAQVKSSVLLAGLNADGDTTITEPKRTRDHTERMLQAFGVSVESELSGEGGIVILKGRQPLHSTTFTVPGDPSSAAFALGAGIIAKSGTVTVRNVMSNPTRTGFIEVVSRMIKVATENDTSIGAEPVCDLVVAGGQSFEAISPNSGSVAAMIDEFPIFAVLAAFADGETRVSGAAELRVKESDRIAAIVAMLRVNGVDADETPDGFVVQGCNGPPPGGGLVETRHDHRIAMSALVMGMASKAPVAVDDIGMIETSYPDFLAHMTELGADIEETN